MLRKALIAFSILLLFLALGLGIIAHALYTANGLDDDAVLEYAAGAVISLVIGCFILVRVTRDKPIDLTDTTTTNLNTGMSGIMTAGLGLILLLFAAPQLHLLITREIERPGSGASIDDFPIEAARSTLQWLVDSIGGFGVSLPVAVVGLALIVVGWRRVRAK